MAFLPVARTAAGGGALQWNSRLSSSTTLSFLPWQRRIKPSFSSFLSDTSLAALLACRTQQKQLSSQNHQKLHRSTMDSAASCDPSTTATDTTESYVADQDCDQNQQQHQSNPKLLLQAFAELQLKPIQETVGGMRVRQHVNPLKASLMAPLAPVKWEAVFTDCSLPLMVDIGCGSGRFLLVLAKRNSGTRNYIGLDVRERLLDRAKLWAEELDLSKNLHFLTTNATVAFNSLVASYPGPLAFVSILCPDPHFKKRHQKRKVVQKQLVDAIVRHLTPGGGVFLQSDVKNVALDMKAQFDEHLGCSLLMPLGDGSDGLVKRDSEGWAEENPLGVPSEREAQVLAGGGRVYRVVYGRM